MRSAAARDTVESNDEELQNIGSTANEKALNEILNRIRGEIDGIQRNNFFFEMVMEPVNVSKFHRSVSKIAQIIDRYTKQDKADYTLSQMIMDLTPELTQVGKTRPRFATTLDRVGSSFTGAFFFASCTGLICAASIGASIGLPLAIGVVIGLTIILHTWQFIALVAAAGALGAVVAGYRGSLLFGRHGAIQPGSQEYRFFNAMNQQVGDLRLVPARTGDDTPSLPKGPNQ